VTDTENEPLDEPMDPGLAEAEVDPEDPKQIELEEAIATARGAASDAKDFVAGLKAVDDALAVYAKQLDERERALSEVETERKEAKRSEREQTIAEMHEELKRSWAVHMQLVDAVERDRAERPYRLGKFLRTPTRKRLFR